MPRLSLYKPERGNDYKFIDRQISEMFQVGGTDVYLHKYIGTESTDESGNVVSKDHTQIQDLVFLENRDRKYDESIYKIRGLYNVQNIDFNLSQFGLFIDNDTIYMTVHINDFIKYIGRKPLSGDVIELPHLRDEFALNDFDVALPRYYAIEDVGRASEGFSATWYPHLYRLKLKKVTDSQQFADIFNKVALDANGDPFEDGTTLKDLLSTYNKEISVNEALITEAETDAPKSGYETRQFYTLAVDPKTGKTVLNRTSDNQSPTADNVNETTDESAAVPVRTGYTGYLVGDGFPVNGYSFGSGIQFPVEAFANDFFLRTDFMPSRLFRYDGVRWIKVEDDVRTTMTNNDTRQTLKTSFINNTKYIYNNIVSYTLNGESKSAIDYVDIAAGVTVVDTQIDFNNDTTGAEYVVFKISNTEIGYTVADSTAVLINNNGKIRLQIPSLDISISGVWRISLCNNREAQRQSLSKALRPKADL